MLSVLEGHQRRHERFLGIFFLLTLLEGLTDRSAILACCQLCS